jgi:tetratricopeptide (TPR) repeat protein
MAEATPESVRGDFDEVEFTYAGVRSRFFRQGEAFVVRTDGPDGALTDYEVKYTFGVEPLQQYLVEFPGGRMQALSLAWDTRPEEEGGQRWFHLLPEDTPAAGDELHWTGRTMNWNYMCAECHSTNLMKGYDPATDTYQTTWSDVDVSCESCHGPGSAHVEEPGPWLADAVAEPDGGWIFTEGETIARRASPLPDQSQVETCAHCHARRATIEEGRTPGAPILDSDIVSRLDEGLYHADGQILDEVYVYGSFVQSRMYTAGVRCSDCHDPHTLELKQPGNAVCAQCHLPSTFDTPTHHNHPVGSAGAQCADCHMPEQTYMVVDPRRDHSMRIPRPHLTAEIGTPNSCTGCHAGESVAWAVSAVEEWYGAPDEADEARMQAARAIHAARERAPGAIESLATVANDPSESGITRATVLSLAASDPSPETLALLTRHANDSDPLVRLGALAGVESFPPEARTQVAFGLLRDSIRAVRIEAARVLAPLPLASLTDAQQELLWAVSDEYVAALQVNEDHPTARTNLANFYVQRGIPFEAETAYRDVIAFDSTYLPAYLNLSDLYRAMGRDRDGEATLLQGLSIFPNDPNLLHARGLQLVRLGSMDAAVTLLGRAVDLAPGVPRYAYVLAIARNSAGDSNGALEVVRASLELHPFDPELLSLAVSLHQDRGEAQEAREYGSRLLHAAPNDLTVRQMARQLGISND